jgi:hypothetical protein
LVSEDDEDGNPSTPLRWAAQAANASNRDGAALMRLLVSAGAKFAHVEKAAHTGTVDGVTGTRNRLAE